MPHLWPTAKDYAKDKIVSYIVEHSVQEKLPSEQMLSTLLGVSRNTVRTALDELAAEGTIVRYHGRGTFVNPVSHKLQARLFPAQSIDQSVRRSGFRPESKYIGDKIEPADATVAAALDIPAGSDVIVSKTLVYADGHFCALCVDYVDATLFGREEFQRLRTQNSVIFQLILEKRARTVAWDLAEFAVTDTFQMPELAQYAGLQEGKSKPFLVMRTTEYSDEYAPLFHAVFYIDTDYIHYGILSPKQVNLDTVAMETFAGATPESQMEQNSESSVFSDAVTQFDER